MANRQFHSSRFEHWTEQAPQVYSYLKERFGTAPILNESGADLLIGGSTRVEVKAAKEWCKTSCSCGTRRRGRFQLHGYEDADYFLFVLIMENGELVLHLESYKTATRRFGITGSINWRMVFPQLN